MSLIADGWYSWITDLPAFTDWLARLPAPVERAAGRVGALRGLLLFAASLRRDRVAVLYNDPGWRSLLVARALLGRRRKLVVFQFLDLPKSGPRRGFERWALRRALAAAQVLSAGEAPRYAARLGIPERRFHHIPFAWRTAPEPGPPAAGREGVISAGRAFCDWETLFAAAAGSDWPLTVVCSAGDLPRVRELNAGGRATVRADIAQEEVTAELRRAAVCAIVMRESGISQGQIRLSQAVDAGAAAVVTLTAALREYVAPGCSAAVVAPGDHRGLRAEIERLLGDTGECERLARAAWERAADWTAEDYLRAVTALARGPVGES